MAGKNKSGQRIEPSFAGRDDRGDDELTVDAGDRIGGRHATRAVRSKSAKGRGSRRRGKTRKPEGRGLFGWLRSLVYWCVVLSIWGAVGIGGLVLSYGARVARARTW